MSAYEQTMIVKLLKQNELISKVLVRIGLVLVIATGLALMMVIYKWT